MPPKKIIKQTIKKVEEETSKSIKLPKALVETKDTKKNEKTVDKSTEMNKSNKPFILSVPTSSKKHVKKVKQMKQEIEHKDELKKDEIKQKQTSSSSITKIKTPTTSKDNVNQTKQTNNTQKFEFQNQIDETFEKLEPSLDKIINEIGFTTMESAKYFSLIYDLYLELDVFITPEITKYIENKIIEILDKLYNEMINEITKQPIEKIIKSLNKSIQLIESSSQFYEHVFKQYSQSSLTSNTFEELNKQKRLGFLNDVKKSCQLTTQFLNIWTISRENNTTEIGLITEILQTYKRYLPSNNEFDKLLKEYYDLLKDQSFNEYTQKNNQCLTNGIKQYLNDIHQFYTIEMERIRIAQLPIEIEKEMQMKMISLVKESEDDVMKILDQIIHEKDYHFVKCINNLFIEFNNNKIREKLFEKIDLLFTEKMTNRINVEKAKETMDVLFDCYEILDNLRQCLTKMNINKLDTLYQNQLLKQSVLLHDVENSLFPLLLSKYLNLAIKKNSSVCSDQNELKKKVRMIFEIAQFVVNRDIFVHSVCKLFIDRIRLAVTDEEREEILIENFIMYDKLSAFKFQQIQSDNVKSKQINDQFIEAGGDKDFNCIIFNSIHDNFRDKTKMRIDEMSLEKFERFKMFYSIGRSTQKLEICWESSSGIISFNKKYLLTSSFPQMMLLLLFNTNEKLTLEEIATKMNIEKQHVKTILSGIIQRGILQSNTQLISDSSEISINDEFISKTRKISVNFIAKQLIETTNEIEEETKENDDDEIYLLRQQILKAAIVRIMKHAKILNCQQLIIQSIETTSRKFKASVSMVRKTIELLINEEFLERHNITDIRYIA